MLFIMYLWRWSIYVHTKYIVQICQYIISWELLGELMGEKHNRTLNSNFNILLIFHFQFWFVPIFIFSQKRLVFDECDRMLELGYKRDVQSVLNAINDQSEKKRQTLLLSATLTQGIEEMSSIRYRSYIT